MKDGIGTEIKGQDYVLNPGRYVGAEEIEEPENLLEINEEQCERQKKE